MLVKLKMHNWISKNRMLHIHGLTSECYIQNKPIATRQLVVYSSFENCLNIETNYQYLNIFAPSS